VLLRDLTGTVFSNGVIPKDWEESYILNLYKGKGDALDHGNYHGLKLTDQAMKLLERVLDTSIRGMVTLTLVHAVRLASKSPFRAVRVKVSPQLWVLTPFPRSGKTTWIGTSCSTPIAAARQLIWNPETLFDVLTRICRMARLN